MRAVISGQRDWLRREFRVGPYAKVELLMRLMADRVGNSIPEGEREEALRELSDAKAAAMRDAIGGGNARSVKNNLRKLSIINVHADLFERVRGGGSADRAATHLRARLISSGTDEWVPSVRTLNSWFAEYRQN